MEFEEVTDSDLLATLEQVTRQWLEENNAQFASSNSQNEDLQVEELLDTTDLQQVSTNKHTQNVLKVTKYIKKNNIMSFQLMCLTILHKS